MYGNARTEADGGVNSGFARVGKRVAHAHDEVRSRADDSQKMDERDGCDEW